MEQKKNFNALTKVDRSNQVGGAQRSEESSRCSPDQWPRGLARLRNAAVLAVKAAAPIAPSPREREEILDQLPRGSTDVKKIVTAVLSRDPAYPPRPVQQYAEHILQLPILLGILKTGE